jgi:hypothetical protein
MDSLKCLTRCLVRKADRGSGLSSDVWEARIDLCVDKESKTYWIMLRLRSDSGEDKKHMSILIPKTALSDALQRASNFEEKGFQEKAEELTDLSEGDSD